MKMNKKNSMYKAIIAFAIALIFILPGSAMFANDEKPIESNGMGISVVEIDAETIEIETKRVDIPLAHIVPQALDSNPAFDGPGDQSHPAFGRTPSGTHMAAYRDVDFDQIIWTFSEDDGASYDSGVYWEVGGDYPSIKRWNDTRFFGTFIPKYDYEGIAYLFECTDPSDYDSYILGGFDFTGMAYNIIDVDIACDSSQNTWQWGVSAYVTDIILGGSQYRSMPVLVFSDRENSGTIRTPLRLRNCAHTDIDIDHENITAYAVYDQDEFLTGDWRLICRIKDFEDLNASCMNFYITGEGNLQYPAVAVDDDNLVILAETDENGNRDIICLYSDDGINNIQSSFVADGADDEMFPDLRHVEGTTFVCTFVKNEELYTCNTTDGGATWSDPVKVAIRVVEEYKTSDICEQGVKAMWEVDNGEDIDIHVGDFEEFSDTQPPVTIHELEGDMEGDVYVSDVTVTLNAIDDLSGVDYTMYEIDDGEWDEYDEPFVISDDGEHTIDFYSVDYAENMEDEKSCTFTIEHLYVEIEIKSISGGLGISMVITNNGNVDATDLEWSIIITGGLFGLIDKEFNGVIPSIAVGDTVTVESGFFLGFGKIMVTVAAECAEGSSDTENANGWQIIVFTLIK